MSLDAAPVPPAPIPAGCLQIEARAEGDVTTLVLAGELDVRTVRTLRDAVSHVIDGGCRDVVLDLSGVAFCDTVGLGGFIAIRQYAHLYLAALTLAHVPEIVLKVLRITGLDGVLTIQADGPSGGA